MKVTTKSSKLMDLKLVSLGLCMCLCVAVLAACGQTASAPEGTTDAAATDATSAAATDATSTAESATEESATASADVITQAQGAYASGIHHAVVQVDGYPEFQIELDADAAPISVSNFCNLVENGYYDGLALYRIADGFVIQGGTLGNTASGFDDSISNIQGEFSGNGVDNPLADAFTRGTVAMARSMEMDSASSTFFITLSDDSSVAASLNGQYAAFGTINETDMQTVDDIVADYAQYATGDMGVIEDEAHMPIMTSVTIAD